ncbi:MAG: hypothetical protein JSS02_15425 [Planctomycetes bacterium]|nr:hypothetical protein [Planctomycetota bacterium]
MFDNGAVPEVESNERVARFIIFSRHYRPSDKSVKPDAFMPHPRVELSLTRHREATMAELWREGERVAALRGAILYGRADVNVEAFLNQQLSVIANPLPENLNHADAVLWPTEKSAQKMKATIIAQQAEFVDF